MLYLPDTNIFIYALAGREPAADFMRQCIESGTLCISVIVAAEFLSGAAEDEAATFEELLAEFDTLPITTGIARRAADYRKMHSSKALRLPDALIAATCREHDAILVTNNQRDFPMVDIKKQILRV
jgi:hypothetical protein